MDVNYQALERERIRKLLLQREKEKRDQFLNEYFRKLAA